MCHLWIRQSEEAGGGLFNLSLVTIIRAVAVYPADPAQDRDWRLVAVFGNGAQLDLVRGLADRADADAALGNLMDVVADRIENGGPVIDVRLAALRGAV